MKNTIGIEEIKHEYFDFKRQPATKRKYGKTDQRVEARDWQVASRIVEMILDDENQKRAEERLQEQKKER